MAVTDQLARAAAPARRRWPVDGLVAGGCAAVALVVAGWRPLVDIDVFWHVLVGQEILDGTPVREAGRGWSLAPVPDTWVSTQWVSEVVLARLYALGGWDAVLWLRLLGVATVLVVLGLTTLRGLPVRAGAWPFALGACALTGFAQERSSLLTYALAPVLGWLLVRALRTGALPPWWAVLVVTAVWANVHGGWVVAAGVCSLAAAARWVDHGLRDRVAVRALGLLGVVAAAACLTPLGPANVVSSWQFAQAASVDVVEWQPVSPASFSSGGLLWAGLVAMAAVVWALGSVRPPRSEVLVVLALLVLGLLAWRNLPVVVLLLAPLLARRLAESWPAAAGPPAAWRSAPVADRLGVALAVLGLVVGAAGIGRSGAIPASQPADLGVRLAAMPGPLRVLDDYNTAGIVLLCGGPGHALVAVDGRTERHGADYLRAYRDLMAARPGWEKMFDALAPTVAVLANGAPLADALRHDRGWRVVATSPSGYLLLVPPTPGNAVVAPVQRAARTDASCTAAAADASSTASSAPAAAATTSDHTSASLASTVPASRRADAASTTGNGGS